jgi:hypothetical protein
MIVKDDTSKTLFFQLITGSLRLERKNRQNLDAVRSILVHLARITKAAVLTQCNGYAMVTVPLS